MISFFMTGTLLGLSAGIAPGPLLTLVISETLQKDIKAGIRVALAPMFTDVPIIVISDIERTRPVFDCNWCYFTYWWTIYSLPRL